MFSYCYCGKIDKYKYAFLVYPYLTACISVVTVENVFFQEMILNTNWIIIYLSWQGGQGTKCWNITPVSTLGWLVDFTLYTWFEGTNCNRSELTNICFLNKLLTLATIFCLFLLTFHKIRAEISNFRQFVPYLIIFIYFSHLQNCTADFAQKLTGKKGKSNTNSW